MKDDFKWHRRYLNLAKEVSTWSKDPSTKVGAVVVNDLGLVVGIGYNGFPRGVSDTEERLFNREDKLRFTVHAEVNAILLAGKEARGSTIYVWPTMGWPPCCHECAKPIVQSGIKQVIGFKLNPEDRPASIRWKESMDTALEMLTEAGVKITEVKY